MSYIRQLAPVIFCVVCGCATSTQRAVEPRSIADIVGASQHNLEVAATTEDQAREDVLRSPTDFDVSIEEDRYSWERTHLFLRNYVDPDHAPIRPITKIVGSRWGLASPPVPGGYVYEVWREEIPEGFHYSIRCVATEQATQEQATLNAANLARFVKDGKLEVSLLPSATPR